ncbi:MAG TPA: RDD family protein [Mycobacteriales bacterium]|nr:RDD family protein [Mycobacteriales bacterium]HVX69393.1 RDD family protein [Mycobacteriales bacterium]
MPKDVDPQYATPASRSPYPESGPGSVAHFGSRLLAFLIDGAVADLIAIIVGGGYHTSDRQTLSVLIAFLLIEIVFVAAAGQTPGMRVAGIAVVREDRTGRPKLRWVLLRTLLLATVAPALIIDQDGRAMHDRAAGTVMVKVR